MAAEIVTGDDHRRVEISAEIDNAVGVGKGKEHFAEGAGTDPVDDALREQGGEAAPATVGTGHGRAELVGFIPRVIQHCHGRHEVALFFRHNLKVPGIGQKASNIVKALDWMRAVRVDELEELGQRASVSQIGAAEGQIVEHGLLLRVGRGMGSKRNC